MPRRALVALMMLALVIAALPAAQPAAAQPAGRDLSKICISKYTKLLRAIPSSAQCQPSESTVQLPEGGPVNACVNKYTGILRQASPSGACQASEYAFVLAGVDILNVCVNRHTNLLRDPGPSGVCQAHEYGVRALPQVVSSVYVTDSATNQIKQFTLDGQFIRQWGGLGDGPGEFDNLYRVTVDSNGNVYATDGANCRVQKFTNYGEFLMEFGECGAEDGQFVLPAGIAIDSAGNIYVVDVFAGRLQKFDSSGNYLTQWGTFGSLPGQFSIPLAVAVDSQDRIYVGDTVFTERVQIFDSSGVLESNWLVADPVGIDFNAAGDVFIAQFSIDNEQVTRFTSDGVFVDAWGSQGVGDGEFDGLQDIAVSDSGVVYASDRGNTRVQMFDLDGSYLGEFGGTGSGALEDPIGIAVFDAPTAPPPGRR